MTILGQVRLSKSRVALPRRDRKGIGIGYSVRAPPPAGTRNMKKELPQVSLPALFYRKVYGIPSPNDNG